MEPNKKTPTPAANDGLAADHMKAIVSEYVLPERYESLVNGPWRLVGQTILQQFGEGSDAWSRMTWFTRILCAAIEGSLKRNDPETVNDALSGFNAWLNSLREEGESYSMCVSAANYAQRRISTQIAEDTQAAQSPAVTDDECVLPGANALEIEDSLEEQTLPQIEEALEPASEPSENNYLTEIGALTDTSQDPLETLSLSLAYSASSTLDEKPTIPEQPELPEQPNGETHMDNQSQIAVKESQANHFENSAPTINAPLDTGNQLTDAASLAPVPMGTWLAFHDQDMPTLARLAMYDTSDEIFMLGNKAGIVVRKISKSELDGLIESGLAQMVEFRAINQ